MLFRWVFSLLLLIPAGVFGQNAVSCQLTAVPPTVKAEGIAERTGDVVFTCFGGVPNAHISGNLVLFLSVNVTNRIAADGTTNVLLTIDGQPSNVPARVTGVNAISFNGLMFNLSPQGTANLRIQNVRGNASQLSGPLPQSITLFASFNGASLLSFTNNQFNVGYAQRGLLSTTSGRLICTQAGSPLPENLTFSNLVQSGNPFSTTRVTEGFASAFASKNDTESFTADAGTRVIVTYSSFTPQARLFVPDFVVGSDADQPTAGGDLGFPASGGRYTPGRRELLLIRVANADSTGAGGAPVTGTPATGPVTFNSVSEIQLVNGIGYAVYEVVDANPAIRESAQIPAFLGLAPGGPTAATESTVNLAPVSAVITASTSAPIPRFIKSTPPNDCTSLNDCNAAFFPRIIMDSTSLTIQVAQGQQAAGFLPIRNGGAGVLQYSATSPAPYLQVTPAIAVNNATIRVLADAKSLVPGTYNTSVVVDAGPIVGTRVIPVAVNVGQPQLQAPVVTAITSAAKTSVAGVVPGSLATIFGSSLKGQAVQVTFDGTPATVLFAGDSQVNALVPMALAGKSSAKVIVTIDGNSSAPATATLVESAPAIFPGAVLNQDWSPNSAAVPANTGSILQMFATGLPSSGTLTARVHDRVISVPYFAGPAPGLTGVQQVDVVIPQDLPTMQTYVYVCGGGVCSPAELLWINHTEPRP